MSPLRCLTRWLTDGVFLFVAIGVLLGPTVVCLDKIISGYGGAIFRLGNVPIPKYLGAGATYWDVFVLDVICLGVLCLGIYYDYSEYKLEKDFRSRYAKNTKYSYREYLCQRSKERDSGSGASDATSGIDDD